jgi:hypothetical protein
LTGDLANPGNIIDQVWTSIRSAAAIVADITGGNVNVYYEIGLAHALGKKSFLFPGSGMCHLTLEVLGASAINQMTCHITCETVEKGLCLTYVPVEKISFKSP